MSNILKSFILNFTCDHPVRSSDCEIFGHPGTGTAGPGFIRPALSSNDPILFSSNRGKQYTSSVKSNTTQRRCNETTACCISFTGGTIIIPDKDHTPHPYYQLDKNSQVFNKNGFDYLARIFHELMLR